MKPEGSPGFGPTLKGFRLGFYWSDRHGAFIRMSTPGDRNVIEVAPADSIPNKCHGDKWYRRWWDNPEILKLVVPLRMLKRCKKAFHFEVNEHGEMMPPAGDAGGA